MTIKFSNNAISTLASGINNSATSITVASGDGAKFPSLTGSEYFRATLIDASNNLEIVKVTARSSDVLTVTRAQESSTARAFATGDRIELRITAQSLLDAATTLTSLVADLGTNGNDINFADGNKANFGSDTDFVIKHDGSAAFLENGTGNLNLRAKSGEASIIAIPDGAVELYHNNSKKLETTSGGIAVTTASSGATANTAADEIVLEGSGDCGMSFLSGTSGAARIYFGDSGNALSGVIKYDHSLDAMLFSANGAERVRIESDGDLHADGDVIAFSTTTPSDIALKSDIEMIPNALDKIDEVRGVTFTRHNGQKSAGIIAQELEKVLPEAVREKKLALHDGKEYKTVEYDAIHGLLINCIKELKEEIKELKNGFTK